MCSQEDGVTWPLMGLLQSAGKPKIKTEAFNAKQDSEMIRTPRRPDRIAEALTSAAKTVLVRQYQVGEK